MNQLRQEGIKGANITLPFKQDAFYYADKLTSKAKIAKAVNTLTFTTDHLCIGDNPDGIGLINDFKNNLNWSLTGRRILLLGAGGAVRGVLQALLEQKPALILLANRTPEKAIQLAQEFKAYGPIQGHLGNFTSINAGPFDFIINGTSASVSHTHLPLHHSLISPQTRCYDMFYSSQPTVFLDWAKQCGSQHCANGLGMLVEQAAESFYIWRGVKPEVAPVLLYLKNMHQR